VLFTALIIPPILARIRAEERLLRIHFFNSIYGIFDEDVEENVVESHISKLRKKLRGHLGYDPINSVRYLGYRLDESICGG
jgi:DNA-binding response OmpR family regulator